MATKTEKVFILFGFLALLGMVVGGITEEIIFINAGFGCFLIFMFLAFVVDTQRRKARVRDFTIDMQAHQLVQEIQLYLLRQDAAKQGAFMCPVCWMVSWNPHDLEHGYCGKCKDFTGVQGPDAG